MIIIKLTKQSFPNYGNKNSYSFQVITVAQKLRDFNQNQNEHEKAIKLEYKTSLNLKASLIFF